MRQRRFHTPLNHRSPGFTLIEVLITLAIIAIVAALSAPAILSMGPNMSLRSAAQELYADIQEAKIKAIKENRDISLITVADWNPGVPVEPGYYIDADDDDVYDGEDANCNNNLDGGEDADGDGILDDNDEKCVNFSKYNYAIKFGTGNTVTDWNAVGCVQTTDVTFNSRGLPTKNPAVSSLFIDYTDSDGNNSPNSFAADVSTAGGVKTYRYDGANWNN